LGSHFSNGSSLMKFRSILNMESLSERIVPDANPVILPNQGLTNEAGPAHTAPNAQLSEEEITNYQRRIEFLAAEIEGINTQKNALFQLRDEAQALLRNVILPELARLETIYNGWKDNPDLIASNAGQSLLRQLEDIKKARDDVNGVLAYIERELKNLDTRLANCLAELREIAEKLGKDKMPNINMNLLISSDFAVISN
jgi:chromosome segregation ATPase